MDNRLENNKKVNPFYEEYWKLKEDDNIEDIVEFIAHSKICRYGHGAEEGEEGPRDAVAGGGGGRHRRMVAALRSAAGSCGARDGW